MTRFRHTIVQFNLKLAFPENTVDRQQIYRRSYHHLGQLLIEFLIMLGPFKSFVLKWVDFQGLEHFHEAKKKNKGIIILSSHLGNWEVMAAAGGLIAKAQLMLVTKRLKPQALHRAVEAARKRCHVSATYEPKTLKDILRHLKENHAVGFVLDQYAGPPVGVRVPFFGVPVGTSLALATLVKRTQASLLPVENYRTSEGRWVVKIYPEFVCHSGFETLHEELAAHTAAYTTLLEKQILAHPEQWLWIHRRFKGDLGPLKPGEWSQPRMRSYPSIEPKT